MRRQRDVRLRVTAVLAFLVAGSTAVSADCRGEVEAAFERLETLDRPYRSEMTIGTYRETTEFIPPDRMRQIVDPANWLLGRFAVGTASDNWIIVEYSKVRSRI
jgi:hypothetical protein